MTEALISSLFAPSALSTFSFGVQCVPLALPVLVVFDVLGHWQSQWHTHQERPSPQGLNPDRALVQTRSYGGPTNQAAILPGEVERACCL